jgi:hypothetical protein
VCDESLACQGLNSNLGHFDSFTLILVSCGESCLLILSCAGSRCDMVDSHEDLGRSGRSGAEDWDGQAKVRYSVVGRSRDRVTLCAVCTVHKETRSASFLVEPQNQVHRVSRFGPQNQHLWFSDLGLKITVMVSWFGPQNQEGYGFSVAPQNRGEDDSARGTRQDMAACFAWKQVTLGFFSLASRLVEARRWVVHVTSLWKLHRVKAEDEQVDATGCVGPFYPKIIVLVYWAVGKI